jgi:hypothetical protein
VDTGRKSVGVAGEEEDGRDGVQPFAPTCRPSASRFQTPTGVYANHVKLIDAYSRYLCKEVTRNENTMCFKGRIQRFTWRHATFQRSA